MMNAMSPACRFTRHRLFAYPRGKGPAGSRGRGTALVGPAKGRSGGRILLGITVILHFYRRNEEFISV
jgi:hypothetical protein